MKLPVFAIVSATFRDLVRFGLRQPFALLIATACIVPINYRLALIELGDDDPKTASLFAESLILSALAFVIWLPLSLAAIRQTIANAPVGFYLGSIPSAATKRYAAYSVVTLIMSQLIWLIGAASASLLITTVILAGALAWFIARATLAFTALAIGRLDLGLARSITMTSKRTFRLIAVLVTVPLAVIAFAIAVAFAMMGLMDEADPGARLYPATLLGISSNFSTLALAIAGAHIYRAIERSPSQNGRY